MMMCDSDNDDGSDNYDVEMTILVLIVSAFSKCLTTNLFEE